MEISWRERATHSIPETAKILNISRSLCYELYHRGELKALRLGQKRLVVPTGAIIRMLEGSAGE
jgi:excisionase family DNA binding protein